MDVKAELAFDVCWEVYRSNREVLEAKRGPVRAAAGQRLETYVAAEFSAVDDEFVADSTLAGRSALDGPDMASCAVLSPRQRARSRL